MSDNVKNGLAREQVERRRLSRLIEALPVLAGFISPDGHILHTVTPNSQTFIWDMPEFAYSHDAITTIIDLCDQAARGDRIQTERPYRRAGGDPETIDFGRGLLTMDPMRDEDGHVTEIAVSLIDCDDHAIPLGKPLERSRLAIANHRIETVLSFAQMVIESLWENEETRLADAPTSKPTTPHHRDRMSERLDTIASIIDPLSDPDLDVIPLEILVDCVLFSSPHPLPQSRLRAILPDADIPMDLAPLMTLMLGELMSNAFHYGAWNDQHPDRHGHVCLEADLLDGVNGPVLRIDWTEDGGPSVTALSSAGFGMTLCERIFPQVTGGTSTMTNLEDGISWTFELPMPTLDDAKPKPAASPELIYSSLRASDLPPESDQDPL